MGSRIEIVGKMVKRLNGTYRMTSLGILEMSLRWIMKGKTPPLPLPPCDGPILLILFLFYCINRRNSSLKTTSINLDNISRIGSWNCYWTSWFIKGGLLTIQQGYRMAFNFYLTRVMKINRQTTDIGRCAILWSFHVMEN